ncbi:diguanylate cyclase [Rhizobiaceae bacterium n13]|uniref:diguanylate cyclase domain-containing protein n=1 Tax=Ferirhizobium litorale TaxID=2927786 RepID=UPI0024B2AD67|nr:diguanylate cyclase [Fererhizobium litorale]MDI7865226.1 diguanylate cyclase [Fererhizobium litorale]
MSLLFPVRPLWVELTVVASISAVVAFPLLFALCIYKEAFRDAHEQLAHATVREDSSHSRAKAATVPVEHAADRRVVKTSESPDGIMLVLKVGNLDDIVRSYGPQWADTLIQSLVQIIHSCVRYGDLVASLSSDEVGIYLPGATTQSAYDICARIRARVLETTFAAGKECQISVMVRLGGTRFADQAAFQALLEAAHRADLAREEAGPPLYWELFS